MSIYLTIKAMLPCAKLDEVGNGQGICKVQTERDKTEIESNERRDTQMQGEKRERGGEKGGVM